MALKIIPHLAIALINTIIERHRAAASCCCFVLELERCCLWRLLVLQIYLYTEM